MDFWIPVLVAVVTGAFGILGSFLTSKSQMNEVYHQLEKRNAVFEAVITEKIDYLTERVEAHNKVVERTYALEQASALHEAEQRRHNERLKVLEGKGAK